MIIKNYAPVIVNGTLCKLISYSRDVVHVQLLTGSRKRSVVMLPRCTFQVLLGQKALYISTHCVILHFIRSFRAVTGLPYAFTRSQFPLSVAYAVTVHKSQGQTYKNVGLFFTGHPFAHGQLYVALSRVHGWENIVVLASAFLRNKVARFLLTDLS